jgi:hypothetical protein
MQHKKNKLLTIRVSPDEIIKIKKIQSEYQQQGIKLNQSAIVRDILINFPLAPIEALAN